MKFPYRLVRRKRLEELEAREIKLKDALAKIAAGPQAEIDLAATRRTLTETKTELDTVEKTLGALKADFSIKNRALALSNKTLQEGQLERDKALFAQLLAAWTPPALCELPLSSVPGYASVAKSTFELAQKLLRTSVGSMAALADPEQFKCRSVWALYWLLTHAAKFACERAVQGTNENATTSAFEAGLKQHGDSYLARFGSNADLEIESALLFEHLVPNLQEIDTGADFVLVISGDGLTGKGCAKLLWVQAKRFKNKVEAFTMTYGQQNSEHKTQCAALRKLNRPELGSTSLYVHYAVQVPFVTSILIKWLDDEGSTVDLTERGARLQELFTFAVVSQREEFTSVEDASNFLESVSVNCGLALRVMIVSSRGETFGHDLMDRLKFREQKLQRDKHQMLPKGR